MPGQPRRRSAYEDDRWPQLSHSAVNVPAVEYPQTVCFIPVFFQVRESTCGRCQAAQNPELKCIASAVSPDAVVRSGTNGLGARVGKRILIVRTIPVMSGLKAFEVFLDQQGKGA